MKTFFLTFIFEKLIHFFPPQTQFASSNSVGLTTLLCHKDVLMFIYNIQSLFYFLKKDLPIFIVDDGSLTKEDCALLRRFFTVTIVDNASVQKKMRLLLKKYPHIGNYVFNNTIQGHRYKLAAFFLNPFKKFILVDADLLFFKKPTELLHWLENDKGKDLYIGHHEKYFTQAHYPEFSFRKLLYTHLHLKGEATFNSGLMCISSKEKYSLKELNQLFKLYNDVNLMHFSVLEEQAFSVMLAKTKSKCLPKDSYQVHAFWNEYEDFLNQDTKPTMRHYSWETKPQFVRDALKLTLQTHFFNHR